MPELKLTAQIGANASQFMQTMRQMQAQVGTFTAMLNRLRAPLSGIAGLIGLGGISIFAKEQIEDAGKLQDAAERLGVSAGLLEQLRHQAEKSGGSLGGIVMAFQELAKSIAEVNAGTPETIDAFKQLGISAERLKTMKLGDAFMESISKVQAGGLNDPNKLKAFLTIFGKGGGELMPMMKEGIDIDNEMKSRTTVVVQELDTLGDAISDKKRTFKNFFRDVIAGFSELSREVLIPMLNPSNWRFGGGRGDLFKGPNMRFPALPREGPTLSEAKVRADAEKKAKDTEKAEKERQTRQEKLDRLQDDLSQKRFNLALQNMTVEEQLLEIRKKAKALADQAGKELFGGDQVKALEMLNQVADLNAQAAQMENKKLPDLTRTSIAEPGVNSLQRIGALNRDSQTVLTLQKDSNNTLKKIEANTKASGGKIGVQF
jgi:hypothetical protein